MPRRGAQGRCARWLLAATLAATTAAADEDVLSWRAALKGASLLWRAPDDPALYPEEAGATSLWRLRLDLEARPDARITVAAAYEQRLRVESSPSGLAGGPLPAEAPAPYRLRQLDWAIAEGPHFSWRHEIDRANAAFHLGRLELIVGRQAVGWGRGVIFGAVDLFVPFTPLEADREWRRGIDAVRAEVRLADRVSLDAVAAFGDDLDHSAFAARLRGYAGEVDGELVVGWRARDLLAGATTSAVVGEAEVHGELCLFLAPEPLPTGGAWGSDRLAPKAVLGGSYRVGIGRGLILLAEYHYSGFGVREPEDALALLSDPAFQERFLRGDSQILGRHAAALLGSIELTNELSTQLLGLVSLTDGSGVASPAATYTLSDAVSLQSYLYLPWGAPPQGLVLHSDYGATPLSFYLQIALHL